MRIRKHAKISPLLYATSSLKAGAPVQTHACQLNQSPWDVMTFSPPSSPPPPPPPPCQVGSNSHSATSISHGGRSAAARPLFSPNSPTFLPANGSGVRVGNGSSERCVPAVEREFTHKVEPDETTPPPLVKNEPSSTINVCCKTDGKSWQCRREAAKGNSLCEHHLSLAKSYSSGAGTHHAAKKSAAAEAEAPRRSRQKKTPASGSSNPYEFYYYSGFGPRWGKRRGEGRKNNNSSMMPKNAADDDASAASSSAISKFDEFDYEEYEDDDEDDEESRDSGRKRVRKPIKARSLKSLL